MVNIGIIGTSEGNGHPYSFSAIVNGYDAALLKKSAWKPIYDYLAKRNESEIGIPEMHISHVWTQSNAESQLIAKIANIENVCEDVSDMISEVDGVIIARDDWSCHIELAMQFLESGKPVFIDKPLTLKMDELKIFEHYLKEGKLMSTSGLRYAKELDDYRQTCISDTPKFISAMVINDWEKYGIHMLDAIYSGIAFDIATVYSAGEKSRTTILTRENGEQIVLSCLGPGHKIFSLKVFFESNLISVNLEDNFTAFKRTLSHFRDFVKTGKPIIKSDETVNIIKTLIAGNISLREKREVRLDEL